MGLREREQASLDKIEQWLEMVKTTEKIKARPLTDLMKQNRKIIFYFQLSQDLQAILEREYEDRDRERSLRENTYQEKDA